MSIPLFLIFLKKTDHISTSCFVNKEQILILKKNADLFDQSAYDPLLPFFRSEKSLIHLCSCPLKNADLFFEKARETIKPLISKSDLLLAPQLKMLFSPKEYQEKLFCLFAFLQNHPHLMGLFDCPEISPSEAILWASPLSCDNAALFYQPICSDFAHLICQNNLFHGAFNVDLTEHEASPLTPHEIQDLIHNRINTVVFLNTEEKTVWGDRTLSKKTISFTTTRVMGFFKKAIEEICQKYVFEKMHSSTKDRLFMELKELFLPYQKHLTLPEIQIKENPTGFFVHCLLPLHQTDPLSVEIIR